MQGIRSNDLVRLSVLESLWRAHSFCDLLEKISGCFMGSHRSRTLKRAGHQPKPCREQSQHHNDIEQTRVLKVDLKT